jgi:hypothetical protein
MPPLSSVPRDGDMMDVAAEAVTVPGSSSSSSSSSSNSSTSLLPSSDGLVGGAGPSHPLAPLHRIQSFDDVAAGAVNATAKTPKAVVSDDDDDDDDDDDEEEEEDDDEDQSPRTKTASIMMDSEDRQVMSRRYYNIGN